MGSTPHDDRLPLLPEGKRWGQGARSIVPYLYLSLLVRPFHGQDGATADSIRNPVFPHMDKALRMLRRGN